MKKILSLLLFVCGPALADDAAVLKCRALADAASRLACYDAMPVAGAASAIAATPASAESRFGLEARRAPDEAPPQAIESTIVGDFDGWAPGTRIKLANGQVWRVIDDSNAVLPRTSNPKVRIERNLFGTLFLRIEGSNSSAKVRRVQ